MKNPEIKRTAKEIQEFHDILHPLVCPDEETKDLPVDKETREKAHAALEVLCWLLGHESGADFPPRVEAVKKFFEGRRD